MNFYLQYAAPVCNTNSYLFSVPIKHLQVCVTKMVKSSIPPDGFFLCMHTYIHHLQFSKILLSLCWPTFNIYLGVRFAVSCSWQICSCHCAACQTLQNSLNKTYLYLYTLIYENKNLQTLSYIYYK